MSVKVNLVSENVDTGACDIVRECLRDLAVAAAAADSIDNSAHINAVIHH